MKTNWKEEWKRLAAMVAVFLACYYLPVERLRAPGVVAEALYLVRWYAREHVLLCLVPAFFIAGAIATFLSQASVIRYLGARANKVLAYGVASVSGAILAVCSCTVLPLFASIYKRGAGLGPATAFLYSGPAINVLAVILTARVLGPELGAARAVGAVAFAVIIGLAMHVIFRGEGAAPQDSQPLMAAPADTRPLWQNAALIASLVAILVFANWSGSPEGTGFWAAVHSRKWTLVSVSALALGALLVAVLKVRPWKIALAAVPVVASTLLLPGRPLVPFTLGAAGLTVAASTEEGESGEWFAASWGFAKQILPLLLLGVLIAGALLGKPGGEGLIPARWVTSAVGGNSLRANLLASVAGALMYFATLTEVPILQGLLGSGMGKGPALALLLAGPALSLPNMLVIRSVMGTKKTLVYVLLVVIMATVTGVLYGAAFG